MSDGTLLAVADAELFYDHVHALKGVTLEVHEGETVALIGANGAGKSSILRAVTGLQAAQLRRDSSSPASASTASGRTRSSGVGIVMVPEGRRVFPFMSVRDNLMMGAFTRTSKAEMRESIERVLARFPRLKERYSQAAGTMSGGEQQMLVIGRALMAKPRLLLLDEPSLGIAPKLVQDIARAIVAINRDEKVSVLLVEQNSRMALRISQRAYALATGRTSLSGASAALLADDRLRALYLGGEL